MGERLILMGVIGKPHGVRGLVRVNAYTEDPQALADYAPLLDKTGRKFGLAWMGGNIAQLTELTASGPQKLADRNAAERLTNTELFAPRSAFPEVEEEEFYLADLVGLTAQDASGAKIGKVIAVHDYGGGTSLEISGATAALLVPFTKAAVPVIDLAAGHVVIEPPADIAAVDTEGTP